MHAAIQTQGLTKIYKGKKGKRVEALRNLNLEIPEGTTFGFVGPNGAGKTTAIKILCGLAFPTSGRAFLYDNPVSYPSSRKNVGYLSEVASYSPYLEPQELLMAFGRIQGMRKNECERRSLELLTQVGLYERRKSRLGEFSKGMLQRFGIAQALLHNPSLLILDEPTSGLDPIARLEILRVLHELKKLGITIFFSSHQLVEVEGLCDYVGIISLGELVFHGTLSQLEAQETQTPFLIRYQESQKQKFSLTVSFLSSRELDGGVHEIGIERSSLDKALNEIHAAGGEVVAVLPQRFPLEEIFVRMITKHQGGEIIS